MPGNDFSVDRTVHLPASIWSKSKHHSYEPSEFSGSLIQKILAEISDAPKHDGVDPLLPRLRALGRETDLEMLFAQLLKMGRDLKAAGHEEEAGLLFGVLREEGVPEDIRRSAMAEFQAMSGQGSSAWRSEYLLGRTIQEAADYKTIVPMILGTTAYGVLRAASATRLAGARFFAPALFGFVGEISVFALTSRYLRHGAGEPVTESVGAELASAALSLGAMKLFHQAGPALAGHPLAASAVGRASATFISPALHFLGLFTARHLEIHFGLRPQLADATIVTDTLASLISLGVGRHLGQAALGRGFAAFQRETFLRSPRRIPQASPLTPAWAMMAMEKIPGTGTLESGKKGEAIRFPESMTIPELKAHVEQGSKSHARELVKRGETDPEAVLALREAIRAYREALEKAGLGDNFVRGNPSFYSRRKD